MEACLLRITKGKHDLQAMQAHLLERAKIEDQYAKALTLSCKPVAFEAEGSLTDCWKNIMSSGASIAGHHVQFATMCTEVAAELDKFVGFLRTTRDTTKEKHDKFLRNKEIAQKYHVKTKAFYHDCILKAEKAITELETAKASGTMTKKVGGLTKAASSATTQVDKANIEYKRAVELLKQAEEDFDGNEAALLEGLEDAETRRLELCRNLFARFSQSHEFMKHAVEQIQTVAQQTLQSAEPTADKRAFISATCTQKPGPVPHVMYEYKPSAVIDKHRGFSGDVVAAGEGEDLKIDVVEAKKGSGTGVPPPIKTSRSLSNLLNIKPPLFPSGASSANLNLSPTPPSVTDSPVSTSPTPTGASAGSSKPDQSAQPSFPERKNSPSTTLSPLAAAEQDSSVTGKRGSLPPTNLNPATRTNSVSSSTSARSNSISKTENKEPPRRSNADLPSNTLTVPPASLPGPTHRKISVGARNSVKARTSNAHPASQWAVATHNYSSIEPTDLNFMAGQRILLLSSPANEDWWTGEVDGKSGTFPKNRVKVEIPESIPEVPGEADEEGYSAMSATCVALHDFVGQEEDELSFKVGEELTISGVVDGWYLGRKKDGDKTGIFPCVYVKLTSGAGAAS